MELPFRAKDDGLLKNGELVALRKRLRNMAPAHDVTTVVACAFDHRTRALPFIYADLRMAPAGVRAVGSALVDAGFHKTRIVLQQWNKNFAPSQMRLDGRIPDMFLVSSMQIHSAQCQALIRDACRIPPEQRPLIIAGGPKTIYEPWDVFSADPDDPWGADIAVTGEEYVLLSLLEVILSERAGSEPLRSAFLRARDRGLLDEIPGLVYPRTDADGVACELIDTGIQRLVSDLDETPHPALGYRLLEPPSRHATLASQALPAERVRKLTPIGSLVMTFGCKFNCPYCPIPSYNQRNFRTKSADRIAEEMMRLYHDFGLRYYFGTDDNFFNDKARAIHIMATLMRAREKLPKGHRRIRWGTEVTIHDTLQMKDYLGLARGAGIRALWLGVEDMTATLVKKGQSVDKTAEAFGLLRQNLICPMPMLMHHDTQPLVTRGTHYGLLNQVRLLRKAGAPSLQVLMITPATGSRLYEQTYNSGLVYASADGRPVETYMIDGNYVVASHHEKPWRKQLSILAAYLYFYNPLRFLKALVRPKTRLYLADSGLQVIGMWGLLKTLRRTLPWAWRLARGRITRRDTYPASSIPMRAPDGTPAAHALPGTPVSEPVTAQGPDSSQAETTARH